LHLVPVANANPNTMKPTKYMLADIIIVEKNARRLALDPL
jgi:hypothetical protein